VQYIQEDARQNTIYTLEYIPHNTCEAIQSESYHTNRKIQYKVMSCFNPSWQLSPTQLLTHCPESDGGENRNTKSEKLMGSDVGILICKAKAVGVSRVNQGSNLLQESRALSRVTVTWADKGCHSKRPLLPSSPSFIR